MRSETVQLSRRVVLAISVATVISLASREATAQSDPLPIWNDGATKKSITDFVARATTQGGPNFVPPADPAFGNSDGDHQMLQWTMAGSGARFAGIVHHTDSTREYAYDRPSKIGKLDKAWDEAKAKGW